MVSVHVAFFLTSAVLFSKADAAPITEIAGSTCGDASEVTIGPGVTRRCCSSGIAYPRGLQGFEYWVRPKYKDTDYTVNVKGYQVSYYNDATSIYTAGGCAKGNSASSCAGDACTWDSDDSFYECKADSCCYTRHDYVCLEVKCDHWWTNCEFWR